MPKATTRVRQLLDRQVDGQVVVEIGDSKQPDFKPQAKLIRHGNRANLSLRYAGVVPLSFADRADAVVADFGGDCLELYDKPEEKAFELELVLSARPATNRFVFSIRSKGVTEWHYQPALTEEEIAEGCERPENVVGSYALYGERGKLFHLYRPHIVDAAGNACWGALEPDLQKELVTVVVPHEFLERAVYPVRVDPTIGYTSVGATVLNASVYYGGPPSRFLQRVAPEAGVQITKGWIYGQLSATSARLYYAIYDNDAGDSNDGPLTALAFSSGYANNTSAQWHEFDLAYNPTEEDDVWIGGYLAGNGYYNFYARYDSSTDNDLAVIFLSTRTYYARKLSTYIEYTSPIVEVSASVSAQGEVSVTPVKINNTSASASVSGAVSVEAEKVRTVSLGIVGVVVVSAGVRRVVSAAATVTVSADTAVTGRFVQEQAVPVAVASVVAVEAEQGYADPYAIMAVSVTGTGSVAVGGAAMVQPVLAGVTCETTVALGSVLQFGVIVAGIAAAAAVQAGAAVIRPSGPVSVGMSGGVGASCDVIGVVGAGIEAVGSCGIVAIEKVLAVSVPISCDVELAAVAEFLQGLAVPVSVMSASTVEAEQVSNNRIRYTVTHPVYGDRVYEVIVTVLKSTENSIETFYFLASENSALEDDVNALIQNGRIRASFPYGTDVSALVPYIEISPEAGIDPASGVVKDFTAPVLYTVVAESGAVQTYETQFTVLASGLNNMLSFRFLKANNPDLAGDLEAVLGDGSAVVVAPGSMTDATVAALKPSIQVSEHAQVIPASLQERSFALTVPYEVTAQNGSKKTYRADLYRKADIGSPNIAGSVTVFNDVFTMSGGGTGIAGTWDRFFYLYRKMSGDCTIEGFLESMSYPDDDACAGIMLRSSLDANAKHAFMCQLQTVADYLKPIQLRARSATGGTTNTEYELYIDQTVKNGFRLVKSGTQIRAYSKRGESGSWYLRDTITLDLGAELYAGIAVTSGTTASACVATVKGFGVVV